MSLLRNVGRGKIRLIEDWMNQQTIVVIGAYIVNQDWTIDVKGSIWLNDNKIETMPEYIKFGKIDGNFNCSGCENLKSLKGAPKEVDGHFVCLGTRFSEEDVRNVVNDVKGNVYCSK